MYQFILHNEQDWNTHINSSKEYDTRDSPPEKYPCLCIQTFQPDSYGSDYHHHFVELEELENEGLTRYAIPLNFHY